MTPARRDGLILAAIMSLAAALRFVGLPSRGEWDDDQGNQLLVMLHWVRDGEVPLLGPVSSFGAAHHGVGFFWLLAPSAFVTDANPVAALATVAVIGIAGVAATWWLGRKRRRTAGRSRRRPAHGSEPVVNQCIDASVEPRHRRARSGACHGRQLARLADASGAMVATGGRRLSYRASRPHAGGRHRGTACRPACLRHSAAAAFGSAPDARAGPRCGRDSRRWLRAAADTRAAVQLLGDTGNRRICHWPGGIRQNASAPTDRRSSDHRLAGVRLAHLGAFHASRRCGESRQRF